jgi:ABC-2 type transport system ATP-binding protein
MQEYIIQSRGLYKAFGDNVALNHIDIRIPKGKIFGMLGPNGAGKTTLIRIITQIFEPDGGEVLFDGKPISSDQIYDIGYMPEERGLYKKMKVGEQLVYLAQLKNMTIREAKEKIRYWMERLDIMDWWNKKVEELSKGMQQKIQFVATVLHNPSLLILDEPFSGLDPINANLIKNEIRELNEAGTTIIFSTHRMEQVEEICEDIVLIDHGNIILDGSVAGIREQFKKNHYHILYEGSLEQVTLPADFKLIEQGRGTMTFELREDQNANALMRSLLDHKIDIHGVTEILPGLNEIFIQQVEAKKPKIPAL